MKILICYFSGTGNTQKVASCYADRLAELGAETRLLSIDELCLGKTLPDGFLRQLEDCDIFGLGYPIYAFNAPPILLKFAKMLPHVLKPKRTFLFSTSGEPLKLNNASSIKLRSRLRRRNFDVTNEYHYCMPYNIMFRHSEKMAFDMWNVAQQLVPLDAKEIFEKVSHRLKRVRFGRLIAWAFRCEHWGGRLNGKFYRVTDECVHCNKCVNDCPVHNIRVDKKGKIKFGGKCLMCMRCAHLCPKNAIKIGLFNSWKVNGSYSFEQPAENEQPQRYNKMLTKAYEQYFAEADRRLGKTSQNPEDN